MKDVQIVGAGPAGLALANLLADKHINGKPISFDILDKEDSAHESCRASSLQPRSFGFFESLKILDLVLKNASMLKGKQVYVDGNATEFTSFVDPETGKSPICIRQNVIEALLVERLKSLGHRINYSQELRKLKQAEDYVRFDTYSRTKYSIIGTAKVLVGCDGANSISRKLALIPFAEEDQKENSFVGDLFIDTDLALDQMHYFVQPDSRLVMVPLPKAGMFRVSGATSMPKGTSGDDVVGQLLEVNELFERGAKVECVANFNFYRMRTGIASYGFYDRVFLCGDSWHVVPPNGGQGLSLAFEDAQAICKPLVKFIETGDKSELEKTYKELKTKIEKRLARALEAKKSHLAENVGQLDGKAESEIVINEEL
ncbi:MAG: FAD-dependent monooxygenase [Bdellovibrionales bacterium]|nr:FAD-dependent monooxygenase [Bdellovibrionales bacterium]